MLRKILIQITAVSARLTASESRCRIARCVAAFTIASIFVAPLCAQKRTAPTLERLIIVGNTNVGEETLRSFLPMREGQPFDPGKTELAREMLKSFYRNQGFADADVSADLDVAAGGASLTLRIDEGPLYVFGETTVEGLDPLPRRIVAIEKTYEAGEPFNKQELFRTQSRLFLTGLFEDIRIQTSTGTARRMNVRVTVEPTKLKWIKGGLGWGSEEKLRASLILIHNNLFRRAYTAEFLATVSTIWTEYRFDFINPYFFHGRTEHRLTASWRAENRDGYKFERTTARAGFARRLTAHSNGSIAFQVNRTVAFDLDPQIAETTPDNADTRSVILAGNRETVDNFFYPQDGIRSNLRYERAGGVLGGTLDFNRVTGQASVFETIWGFLTTAATLRAGFIEEYDDTEAIPIFERLFMGGANSVRGYAERGVGPMDALGAPLGGTLRLGATAELRFPLVWILTGAVFLDGGMVGDRAPDVQPARWKYGAGAGLRLQTPVGPIRLDYGYKLNRSRGDNDPWRIHFSLGESF